jgi:hypothetical protein
VWAYYYSSYALEFSGFEVLNKQLEKARGVLVKEGAPAPTLYIRTLVRLEDALKEVGSNKTLSAKNAKALNTLKQRLKKNNKNFESQIKDFREVRTHGNTMFFHHMQSRPPKIK